MSRAIEIVNFGRRRLESAKQRLDPDGLAVSTALSIVSVLALPSLDAGFSTVIQEIAKSADPNALRAGVIGGIAVSSALSVGTEAFALRNRKFSASGTSSLLNVLTGRSILASTVSHLQNYARLAALHHVALDLFGVEQDIRQIENSAPAIFAINLWFTAANTLISTGKAEMITDPIKRARQSIVRTVRRSPKIG